MMKKQKVSKKLKKAIRIASITSFFVLAYCNYSTASELGDINNDNKITIEDANVLKSYLVKQIDFNADQKVVADINKDGKITISDLSLIKGLYKSNDSTDEERILEKLRIASLPDKLIYAQGDSFDPSGLVIMATYTNGDEEDVTSMVELSGFESGVMGKQTIIARYKDKTVSFNINVSMNFASPTINRVIGIEITKKPNKLTYQFGESLDLKGLKVSKKWLNGDKQEINNYTVSGYSLNKIGRQTITISYTEYDDKDRPITYKSHFYVNVIDEIEKIEVVPISTNLNMEKNLNMKLQQHMHQVLKEM